MKVTGTLFDGTKEPLAGYSIVARHGDVDLLREEVLRRGKTGRDGAYSLSIDLQRHPRGVNVRVAVLGERAAQLWTSPIHYNAKADLKIDATISDRFLGITQYRRLVNKVESRVPLKKLVGLNPTQRTYLAGETGVAAEDVARLIAAIQLHGALPAVTTEDLFGILKQGLPSSLEQLAALDEKTWRTALGAAMAGNVIRTVSPSTVEHAVSALAAEKAKAALRVVSPGKASGPAAFVSVAVGSEGKRNHVASLVTRHDGVNAGLWKALERSQGLAEVNRLKAFAAVDDLLGNDTELLGEVAGHLRRGGEEVSPTALATIKPAIWRTLVENAARRSGADVPKRGAGAKGRTSVTQTAGNLAAQVAYLYPTQVIASGLDKAPAKGYFGKYKKGLSSFLERNKAFDVRSGLPALLPPSPRSQTGGAKEDPITARVKTLTRLFRALPEAQAPADAKAALDSKSILDRISALADSKHQYRSSLEIARRPRAAFAAELARDHGNKAYWEKVHDRATAMADVAHFSAVSLLQRARVSTGVTQNLPGAGDETAANDQPGVANLRTLLDYVSGCQCEECTSVTSPAAYLADILNFLQGDVATSDVTSPYEVMIERRPDIPHILLNCDNTNVVLPYIDVVNELLEDEVLRQDGEDPVWAPYRKNVTIPVAPTALDNAALGDAVAAARAKVAIASYLNTSLNLTPSPPNYDFDADLQVSITHFRDDGSGDRWFVFNKGWLVELSWDGRSQPANRINVAVREARAGQFKAVGPQPGGGRSYAIAVEYVSRQTYGTSDELEANPLFRNARVAQILEGQEFPPGMPPGLALMEARLFLQHLKLPREQLIRQLKTASVDAWTVEYLGLSAADIQQLGLIGGPRRWGFAGANVTAKEMVVDPQNSTKLLSGTWSGTELLGRVDVLIGRARISYIDLLELLQADTVNPPVQPNGVRAAVVSTDESDPATCDLSKLQIQLSQLSRDLYQLVLERMRRFLRLQRHVGWKTWELDLALRQLNIDLLGLVTRIGPELPGAGVAGQLGPLAILKWVKAALHLGHADACALLGAIDTVRRIDFRADGQPTLPSQYETLLLNRAVTNPVDRRFLLTNDLSALRTPPTAADGTATLAAAFQVKPSDISLILGQLEVQPADTLILDLISKIYQRVLYASAFGISVQEMIWIERLNGGLPAPDECMDFIDRVTLLQRSTFSVTEAWFLLADAEPATDYLVPGDDEIAQQLDALRQQLVKIEADHAPGPPDTDGSQLRRILGELDFGGPLTDDLVGIATDTAVFSTDVTLPAAVVSKLDPTAGVPFVPPAKAAFLATPAVAALVRADSGVLVALHPLTRSDRATLLRTSTNHDFRKAVEKLFALGKLSYQPPPQPAGGRKGTLTCRGLLPANSAQAIQQRIHDPKFTPALQAIVTQQSELLTRKLQYRALAQYEFPLATPTATPFTIPAELQPYVYLDAVRNVLIVRGQLTGLEITLLRSASTIPPATLDLVAGPLPTKVNVPPFLSQADIAKIFDPNVGRTMPTTTADISRALLVTHGLLGYARDVLDGKATVAALGGALGLTNDVTQYLIDHLTSATPPGTIGEAFAALGTAGPLANMAPYLENYRRLSKIALLLQRLNIKRVHLAWLFDYPDADWLQLPSLEAGAAAAGTDLSDLTELIRLIAVAKQSPYSPQLVSQLLTLAADPLTADLTPILKLLSDNSRWSKDDLPTICTNLGIAKADFLSARSFDRLRVAMSDLVQLGATAAQAIQLTIPAIDDPTAALAKSLAKSKHAADEWLTIVEPISNILREAKRTALVDYLVTHPRRTIKGKALWHDVDTLYAYLLVDIQMGACMKTTRIRLALNAIQLFVQRCLLNLEDEVEIGDDAIVRQHWDEWEAWRSRHRIWQANREIFLHPEEYLDPTLRDDTTPFFQELESELLQTDITNDTAEAAVLNYLHKLDQVRKLEVMGMFVEGDPVSLQEQLEMAQGAAIAAEAVLIEATVVAEVSPSATTIAAAGVAGAAFAKAEADLAAATAALTGAKQSGKPSVLHIVARTPGEPHDWFYRTLTRDWPQPWDSGVWSAWEKIDTDVQGEHALPVVFHGHLYLFWALFDQKSARQNSQELNDKTKTEDSKEHWYIKFAWSERRNGKWTGKRVSTQSLRTPFEQSGDQPVITEDYFSFKTGVTDDQVVIKCYGPVAFAAAFDTPTDPTTTGTGTTDDAPFYTGNSQVTIDFIDPKTYKWRNDIDIVVSNTPDPAHPNQDPESFTLKGRDCNGQFNIWSQKGWDPIPLAWRLQTIDVKTKPPLTKSAMHQTTTNPLVTPRPNGEGGIFNELSYTAGPTITTFTPPPPSGSKLPIVVPGAPVLSRIGRFNLDICGGDLVPTIESSTETIPTPDDDNLEVRGMMFAEKEDPIVQGGASRPFLMGALGQTPPGVYRVLAPHQTLEFSEVVPFFFQTDTDAYLVTGAPLFRFRPFYHPYACDFLKTAYEDGVPKLFRLATQLQNDGGQAFQDDYAPDDNQLQLTEPDEFGQSVPISGQFVDFSRSGAFGIYNWEVFFHMPWLIATRLQANLRFEDARKWFHYIFDPTSRPGADAPLVEQKPTQRFWNFLPFWKLEGRGIQSVDDLLRGAADLTEAFREWREDPFKPFVVARARWSAFMWAIIEGYIDNLIAWADQLYAQFVDESVDQATHLYVLVRGILGPVPQTVPPRVRQTLQTYESLQEHELGGASPVPTWQNFSDVMVEIESFIPPSAAVAQPETSSPLGRMWAFCVPPNDKLLKTWPLVEQRLFNVRHCRDIEGVERSFPIWDPPIDPGLLVRAAAAGLDIASVLGDINAATPNHRFSVMHPRAIDFCNEVKSFGAALLSALENGDAEGLSRLRAKQDVTLSKMIKDVRTAQLTQSTRQREAAEQSRAVAEARVNHYLSLTRTSPTEDAAAALGGAAIAEEVAAGVGDALAGIAAFLPQLTYGTSGVYSSPVVTQSYGGDQFSRAASATAAVARASGAVISMTASGMLTQAGYDRRFEDWNLQITVGNAEIAQIKKQILAAEIQEDIAQKEIDNQQQQADNAQAILDYLTGTKYTNQQLFVWLQGELSALYFQAYKLAFDLAKKTQRTFQWELGAFDASFVQFGSWDSLKKGLLAGERLQADLRRMEAAYLDQNVREQEFTKRISLSALNPAALILLKTTGECEVEIPEWVFEMDHSGDYLRRLKTVAISIPCIVGTYTSVNCTATQVSSRVRLPDSDPSAYANPANFHEYFGNAEAIVTSSALEDAGLFEVNLHDERYLPFEGTGAISRWRLEMPLERNEFDPWTITNVIFHFRYTARRGGDDLGQAAAATIPFTGASLFSLKHDFGSEWNEMTTSAGTGNSASSKVTLSRDRFPFFFTTKGRALSIKRAMLYAVPTADADDETFPDSLILYLTPPAQGKAPNPARSALKAANGASDTSIGPLPGKTFNPNAKLASASDALTWMFEVTDVATFEGNVDDLLLICQYEIQDAT